MNNMQPAPRDVEFTRTVELVDGREIEVSIEGIAHLAVEEPMGEVTSVTDENGKMDRSLICDSDWAEILDKIAQELYRD